MAWKNRINWYNFYLFCNKKIFLLVKFCVVSMLSVGFDVLSFAIAYQPIMFFLITLGKFPSSTLCITSFCGIFNCILLIVLALDILITTEASIFSEFMCIAERQDIPS